MRDRALPVAVAGAVEDVLLGGEDPAGARVDVHGQPGGARRACVPVTLVSQASREPLRWRTTSRVRPRRRRAGRRGRAAWRGRGASHGGVTERSESTAGLGDGGRQDPAVVVGRRRRSRRRPRAGRGRCARRGRTAARSRTDHLAGLEGVVPAGLEDLRLAADQLAAAAAGRVRPGVGAWRCALGMARGRSVAAAAVAPVGASTAIAETRANGAPPMTSLLTRESPSDGLDRATDGSAHGQVSRLRHG